MSLLAIQIPPRNRVRAHSSDVSDTQRSAIATEYLYAISPDGVLLQSHGCCAASLLPKATTVIAVLSDQDISWHRINLPKAPAAKLKPALVGLLEEALLEEADDTHLALEPSPQVGAPTWVAATQRAWLTEELALLEKAQIFVDRVVPISWPDEPARGHFSVPAKETPHPDPDQDQSTSLSWAHPDGVAALSLHGGLARAIVPPPKPDSALWSATPAAVETAETWLGFPVTVMAWPQRALQATRTLWNLRQFDLARKNRGLRAVRDLWRQALKPEWRPFRLGAIGLAILQVVGLNLWAVQQRHAVTERKASMKALLQTTHPQERDVLDAPAQMQRATNALKTTAGQPADNDLEPLLAVAASAWPPDRPPVDNLRYENGKLSLAIAGWTPEQITQFSNQIRPGGWQIDNADGRLSLSKATSAPGAAPKRTP